MFFAYCLRKLLRCFNVFPRSSLTSHPSQIKFRTGHAISELWISVEIITVFIFLGEGPSFFLHLSDDSPAFRSDRFRGTCIRVPRERRIHAMIHWGSPVWIQKVKANIEMKNDPMKIVRSRKSRRLFLCSGCSVMGRIIPFSFNTIIILLNKHCLSSFYPFLSEKVEAHNIYYIH